MIKLYAVGWEKVDGWKYLPLWYRRKLQWQTRFYYFFIPFYKKHLPQLHIIFVYICFTCTIVMFASTYIFFPSEVVGLEEWLVVLNPFVGWSSYNQDKILVGQGWKIYTKSGRGMVSRKRQLSPTALMLYIKNKDRKTYSFVRMLKWERI